MSGSFCTLPCKFVNVGFYLVSFYNVPTMQTSFRNLCHQHQFFCQYNSTNSRRLVYRYKKGDGVRICHPSLLGSLEKNLWYEIFRNKAPSPVLICRGTIRAVPNKSYTPRKGISFLFISTFLLCFPDI